jgi:hypothetical protein
LRALRSSLGSRVGATWRQAEPLVCAQEHSSSSSGPFSWTRWGAGWWAPLPIGAIAAFLRLWQHDLVPFLDDEARLLAAAQDILAGHIPLTSGFPTSIHINEPPLAATLAALPMTLSHDPMWVSGCLAMLDALAAVFVYLAAKHVAGQFAGLAAGLLYMVAPAAIYFSRRIYYSEAEPFFIALALLMCIRAWKWKVGRALGLGLVAAACAAELHATAAGILAVWLLVALAAGRFPSYRPVLVGAGVVLLTLAPYIYLQVQTHGADLQAAARFAAEPKLTDAQGLKVAASLIGGGIYQQQLLPRSAAVPDLMLDPAGWVLLMLVVAGLGLTWRYPSAWPAGALLVAEALLTLRHAAAVLPYYELAMLPAAALLAGVALAAVPWRFAAAGVLAAIVGWQALGLVRFQAAIAADGPDLQYGVPLRYEEAAARALPSLPAGSQVHFAQEGNQQFSFPYLTGGRYQASNSDSRYGLALPSGSSAYYVVQAGGLPFQFLSQASGPPLHLIRTTSGKPLFGIFSLPASASRLYETLPGFRPATADFAGAVRILGYAADELAAGKPSQVAIAWQVVNPNLPLPPDVQQFAHLVDAQGHRRSTDPDERAYPTSSWQTGDTVLTWFQLSPPAATPTGGYWLETGFYGYPGAEPLGLPLRVGPLRVAGSSSASVAPPRAVFGGELALLDARVAGKAVRLTWQAVRQPEADYTVFVHVLDGSGRLLEQDDSPPQSGGFPTTLWQAGDVAGDVHMLPSAPPAGAQLEVGLYTRPDLRRVATADGADHIRIPVG